MPNYSDLKAPKKEEMNEDFEKELLEEEGSEHMPSSTDIAEALAPYSKEEIQKYLEEMDEDNEEEDIFAEADEEEEITEPVMGPGGA